MTPPTWSTDLFATPSTPDGNGEGLDARYQSARFASQRLRVRLTQASPVTAITPNNPNHKEDLR
jgi:hypothetical protein